MSASSRSSRSILRALTRGYSWVLSQLLVLTTAVLIVPVTLQIVSRYTDLIPAYIWTEELARFMFVWTIMVGSMLGVREGTHFDVDVWPKLAPKPGAVIRLIARFGVLIIAIVFVIAGWQFTKFAWNRTSELADLPLWLIHVAWPLTGVTWLIFIAEESYDDIQVLFGRDTGVPSDAADTGAVEAKSGGHE
jgi:TRAP-type C4-dicarboxylate transport system permease small subunit